MNQGILWVVAALVIGLSAEFSRTSHGEDVNAKHDTQENQSQRQLTYIKQRTRRGYVDDIERIWRTIGCRTSKWRSSIDCHNVDISKLGSPRRMYPGMFTLTLKHVDFYDFKRVLDRSTLTFIKNNLYLVNTGMKSLLDLKGVVYLGNMTEELKSENNNILELEDNLLRRINVPKITTLNVTYSGLREISSTAFNGGGSLETIDLIGNHIRQLKNGTFQDTVKLETLYLNGNSFGSSFEEPVSPFKGCGMLEVLLLDNCGITGFNPVFFDGLYNLTGLTLRGNRLQVVSRDWNFPSLKLKQLYLSENQITRIEEGALEHLPLQQMKIRDNNLTTLPIKTQMYMITRSGLRLKSFEKNPWVCDCRLLYLMSYIRLTNDLSFTCSNLADKPLLKSALADPKNMNCGQAEEDCYEQQNCSFPCSTALEVPVDGSCGCIPGTSRGQLVPGCQYCKGGEYQPKSNMNTCLPCGEGAMTDITIPSPMCSCKPNFFTNSEGSCEVCPRGTIKLRAGVGDCAPCPPGSIHANCKPDFKPNEADPRILKSGCDFDETLQVLDCEKMSFLHLTPFNLPSQLKSLHLSNSDFYEFKRLLNTSIKPALKVVKITNSKLQSLRDLARIFNLREVKSLQVYDDNVPTLEANVFQKLHARSLNYLTIQSSGLTKVSEGVFYCLNSVLQIDLQNNNINGYSLNERNMFNNLTKLKQIDLNGNKITYLRNWTFRNLPELGILSLSKNPLGSNLQRPVSPFQNCPELGQIFMDDCNITGINPAFFIGLDKLTTLSLKKNKIQILSNKWRLPSTLNTLILIDNEISKIDEGSIEYLKPSAIALQFNKLTTLSLKVQTFLVKNVNLHFLYNNPWECNCALLVLINHVREMNDASFTCGNLNDTALVWSSLADPKNMNCKTQAKILKPSTAFVPTTSTTAPATSSTAATTSTTAATTSTTTTTTSTAAQTISTIGATTGTTISTTSVASRSRLMDLLQKKHKLLKSAQTAERQRYKYWKEIINVELNITKQEEAIAGNQK